MAHYWLTVLIKAFDDANAFIGQSRSGIAFAVLILGLTAIWSWKEHGLRDAIKHWWRTAGEGAAIAVAGWLVVFLVHFVYAPFHLQYDEQARKGQAISEKSLSQQAYGKCTGDLQTANAKVELLKDQVATQQGVVNSQQGTVDSLQGTLSKQQAAVTTCVGDLAKAIIPEPQKTNIFKIAGGEEKSTGNHITILFLTTNKPITPVHLIIGCEHPVKTFGEMFANGSAMGGGIQRQEATAADIYLTFPTWTAENPLVVTLNHTEEDVGQCSFRLL